MIRVRGSIVTLTGTVDGERALELAVKETYAVDGVEHVENRLRVATPPINPRGM